MSFQASFDCLAGQIVIVKNHIGHIGHIRGSKVRVSIKLMILAGGLMSTSSCFIVVLRY